MTHFVVIHAMMVSWYPRRRPSYPTCNIMLDLDPWGSPSVVEVVKEAHDASCVMKKLLKKSLDSQKLFDPHLMA